MTSYSKKLYRQGRAKELNAFYTGQQFETKMTYGKHTTLAQFSPVKVFEQNPAPHVEFGKREPDMRRYACDRLCDHPACAQGCSLARHLPQR